MLRMQKYLGGTGQVIQGTLSVQMMLKSPIPNAAQEKRNCLSNLCAYFTVTSGLAPKYKICARIMSVTDQWLLLLITGLENNKKN